MTRRRKFDPEQDERDERAIFADYSFDRLAKAAENAEALAATYLASAEAGERYRAHLTGRGALWSATYHVRRDREEAAKWARRAEIRREIAETRPTCELPGVES
jgi:hypothetical protein